MAKTTF